MKKLLLLFLICFGLLRAEAQTYTILTVTNTPANGNTFTANGIVFYWTNTAPVGSYAIASTNTPGGNATNLFNTTALVLPLSGISLTNYSSNQVEFIGIGLTVSTTGTWASLSSSTNSGSGIAVVVPMSSFASTSRVYVASQLVSDLNTYNTNIWQGAFQGDGSRLTNISTNSFVGVFVPYVAPAVGVSYSNSFTIQDSNGFYRFGYDTALFGTGQTFMFAGNNETGIIALTNNLNLFATNVQIFPVNPATTNTNGLFARWQYDLLYVSHTNSTATGLVSAGQTNIGTNTITAATVLTRYVNSSMANGGNQDVATSTNTYIGLTGATASFSTAGFAGGIADRFIMVESLNGQPWTINNESGLDSTPTNRVRTPNAVDLTLTGAANVVGMVYNGTIQRWIVTSINGVSAGGSGVIFPSMVAHDSTTNFWPDFGPSGTISDATIYGTGDVCLTVPTNGPGNLQIRVLCNADASVRTILWPTNMITLSTNGLVINGTNYLVKLTNNAPYRNFTISLVSYANNPANSNVTVMGIVSP